MLLSKRYEFDFSLFYRLALPRSDLFFLRHEFHDVVYRAVERLADLA